MTATPEPFIPDQMAAKLRAIARELRQQPLYTLEDEALARRLETYARAIVQPELDCEKRVLFARFNRLSALRWDGPAALV